MRRWCAGGLLFLAACGEVSWSEDGSRSEVRLSTSSSPLTCRTGIGCPATQHPAGYYCSTGCGPCTTGTPPTATDCRDNTGLSFQSCDSNCGAFGYSNGMTGTSAACDRSGNADPDTPISTCEIRLSFANGLTLDRTEVSEPGPAAANGTVTLSNPVPASMAGGIQIDLSISSDIPANAGAVTIPATKSIGSPNSSATFPITVVGTVEDDTHYTITARLHDAPTNSRTATLTLDGLPKVQSVSLSSYLIAAGQTLDGTVTLDRAAPAGGLSVTVTSDSPVVPELAPFIPVAEGQTTSEVFHITSAPEWAWSTLLGSPVPEGVTAHLSFHTTVNGSLPVEVTVMRCPFGGMPPILDAAGSSSVWWVVDTCPLPAGQ